MAYKPYLEGFFRKLLVEMGEFLTSQQMGPAALLAIAALLYQYHSGKLTWFAFKDNAATVVYPFVWVVCAFGCYFVVKAAISLHREMVAEVAGYKPAIPDYKPKPPSPAPGILAAGVSISILALISYVTFVAAFPRIPTPVPASERMPYPWISARGTILGNPMRVQLELTVREYPPSPDFVERSILPISTVFAVHVDLYTHLRIVEPGDGEDICSYLFNLPEFRNELTLQRQLGYITVDKDVMPITMRESARNGVWDGYIVFYRRNNAVDYEQVLHGTVVSSVDGSQHNMTIKESRRGGHVVTDSSLPDQLTKEMLKHYGVPIVGTDRPRYKCPSLGACPRITDFS